MSQIEKLWEQTERNMREKHGTFVPHSIVLEAFCETLLQAQREACTEAYNIYCTIGRRNDVAYGILNAEIKPTPQP